jgi:hypothetical protein
MFVYQEYPGKVIVYLEEIVTKEWILLPTSTSKT